MKTFVFSAFACLSFYYSFAQSPRILVPYRTGNKWGYSDTLGKVKINPRYDTVSLFDYDIVYKGNHVIAEAKLGGKPMMINEEGISVVPPKYDYIELMQRSDEPVFIISRNNKFGLFARGKELFPPVSDWLAERYPGHYEVHINGKYGLINSKGEILIPANYDLINKRNQKSDSIEYDCIVFGKEPDVRKAKLLKYNWISQRVPETEELDYIPYDNINSIIDSARKQFELDSFQMKYNNAVVFYKDSAKGIILPDATKKIYFFSKPYDIRSIKYFSPRSRNSWNRNSAAYIVTKANGKYGVINEREEQVLPFEYDNIEEMDGFFLLKQNGKIGFFILNTFYPPIQPAYNEYIGKKYIPVNNGWRFSLLKVVKNGRSCFVGENGVNYFKD